MNIAFNSKNPMINSMTLIIALAFYPPKSM
jgi:hypothetical protein